MFYWLKENVLLFIRDMFSFDKVRFTTVNDLSKDIQKLAQKYIARILEMMAAHDDLPNSGVAGKRGVAQVS